MPIYSFANKKYLTSKMLFLYTVDDCLTFGCHGNVNLECSTTFVFSIGRSYTFYLKYVRIIKMPFC